MNSEFIYYHYYMRLWLNLKPVSVREVVLPGRSSTTERVSDNYSRIAAYCRKYPLFWASLVLLGIPYGTILWAHFACNPF